MASIGKKIINIGDTFGDLTITNKISNTEFVCKCKCGNIVTKTKQYLLYSDFCVSCGCRKSKHTAELNKIYKKKYCKYDLTGPYGVGWTTNNNSKFYFDLEDYNKIKDFAWNKNSDGYIVARNIFTNKPIKLHQLILNTKHIDHINHNKADNRKSNLRPSNDLLNSHNRSISSNNKSGYTGISFHTRTNRWRATITVNGKHIELREFIDIADAVKARKNAEEKYYKEWSYNNSMKKEGD